MKIKNQTAQVEAIDNDPLLVIVERWRDLSQKLRWRAMSERSKGESTKSTMNDTTAHCLEMCANQIEESVALSKGTAEEVPKTKGEGWGLIPCCDKHDPEFWWRRIECMSCGKTGPKASSKRTRIGLWNRMMENSNSTPNAQVEGQPNDTTTTK